MKRSAPLDRGLISLSLLAVAGCRGPAPPATPLVELEDSQAVPAGSLLAGVGSADDPEGKEGLALLTAALAGEAGGLSSTWAVGPEATLFSAPAGTAGASPAWSSWLAPSFQAAALSRRKSVQKAELTIELPWGDETRLLEQAFRLFLWEGHPAAHPAAGTVVGIEAITPAAVEEFFARFYRPGNLLAGTGGPREALLPGEVLEQALSALPGEFQPPSPLPPPPPAGVPEILIVDRPGAAAWIMGGFSLPFSPGEEDYPALIVAASILGAPRAEGGRLRETICRQRGLAAEAWAEAGGFPDPWQQHPRPGGGGRFLRFALFAGPVDPSSAGQVLALLAANADRLVQEGVTGEDLDLHRAAVRQRLRLTDPSLPFRLRGLMEDRWFGNPGFLAAVDRRLETLRLEEVNAALVRHLRPEKFKAVIVTGDGAALRSALLQPRPPAPAENSTPALPFALDPDRVHLVPVTALFHSSRPAWR